MRRHRQHSPNSARTQHSCTPPAPPPSAGLAVDLPAYLADRGDSTFDLSVMVDPGKRGSLAASTVRA